MSKSIGSTPTPWRDVILVCRKCSKRLDGGFGKKERESLRDVLRSRLRAAGRRRDVRIMEVGCVNLCPNNAVAALRGGNPGDLFTVPKGSGADDVLGQLGIVL